MIKGSGPSSPEVVLVIDGATKADVESGYALSGFSEKTLSNICSRAGLNHRDFYRTALIKEPLLSDEPEEFEKNSALLELYSPIFNEEIRELQPNLIIPLGEYSFRYLSEGYQNIWKYRGSVMGIKPHLLATFQKPCKILPILGPEILRKVSQYEWISSLDFAKVLQQRFTPDIPESKAHLWIARTAESLRNFLKRSFNEAPYVFFDFETFLGIPTCISLCFDGIESVCIPFLDQSVDIDNRVLMQRMVAQVLASEKPKINQNIKFDWRIAERWGYYVNNVIGDTMLAAGVIYCEFPKNLGFLTSIYTELPYHKEEGKEWDPFKYKKDRFYMYSAKDSLAVAQIYPKQQSDIDELGVRFVYDSLIKLMPIYRRMEDRGLRVDEERRKYLLAKYEGLYHTECLKLSRLTNWDHINPLSPKQIIELLYDILKYKPVGGQRSSNEESVLNLIARGAHDSIHGEQILRSIIASRKLHKLIEILELNVWPDGRFRNDTNLVGTETGRTTGGETIDTLIYLNDKGKVKTENLGHSHQTMGKHGFFLDGVLYGKDVRSIYVPSPGYQFVEVDLSGAEARVDTVLAGNFDLLKIFDGPIGIHRLTGSWVYNCKPEEIKKNTLEYLTSKIVRHAAERNLKDKSLAIMLQISIKEAGRILSTVHKFQPELREVFHRDIINEIRNTRTLRAPNGRIRQFFGRIDDHAFNEGISFIPQAVVSDQTKFSFIPTMQECPYAYILVEAHDGSLAEVPKDKVGEYIETYKKNIETEIDFRQGSIKRDFSLVIPSEASVGENWQEMKDWKE